MKLCEALSGEGALRAASSHVSSFRASRAAKRYSAPRQKRAEMRCSAVNALALELLELLGWSDEPRPDGPCGARSPHPSFTFGRDARSRCRERLQSGWRPAKA